VAGREVQVAQDARGFVDAVLRLLADPLLRAQQARSAKAWVEANYAWSRHAAALVEEYRHAMDSTALAALVKAG
jgi:glycosyltransferase involved in cell wall biosynthesis